MINTLFTRHYVLLAPESSEGTSGGGSPVTESSSTTATGGTEGGTGNTPGSDTEGTGENTTESTEGGQPSTSETQTVDTPGDNIPEYTPEAAAKLEAQYTLNEPQDTESGTNGSEPKTDESTEEYTIAFPEAFTSPESAAFGTILAPIARESGLDGTAYGKLFADSYAAIEAARQKSVWEHRFRQDAELKRDWGSNYESNMKTARGHIAFLKQKAGLTDDDLACFQSPKGMRALYAMATAHGEKPAAGLTTGNATEKSWADAVLKDPNHPDRNALFNTSDPRYKEINARFRRAHGC